MGGQVYCNSHEPHRPGSLAPPHLPPHRPPTPWGCGTAARRSSRRASTTPSAASTPSPQAASPAAPCEHVPPTAAPPAAAPRHSSPPRSINTFFAIIIGAMSFAQVRPFVNGKGGGWGAIAPSSSASSARRSASPSQLSRAPQSRPSASSRRVGRWGGGRRCGGPMIVGGMGRGAPLLCLLPRPFYPPAPRSSTVRPRSTTSRARAAASSPRPCAAPSPSRASASPTRRGPTRPCWRTSRCASRPGR